MTPDPEPTAGFPSIQFQVGDRRGACALSHCVLVEADDSQRDVEPPLQSVNEGLNGTIPRAVDALLNAREANPKLHAGLAELPSALPISVGEQLDGRPDGQIFGDEVLPGRS